MTAPRRYTIAPDVARTGDRVVGGSPLRTFVLSEQGMRTLDRIAAGETVARTDLVDRLLAAGVVHPMPTALDGPYRESAEAAVTTVTPTIGSPERTAPGVILVDDGSDPPVPEARVRLDSNRGPAAARNAGLALVTTPYVAFVDTDVHIPHDWLSTLMPHFDDPDVVLVAPRVRSRPGPSRLERYERRHSALDLGSRPATVAPGRPIAYVPSTAVVARTSAIRAIGGFDESLRFGEDVDLVWRLVDAGGVVRYEPASVVVHPPRPTWRAWLRQRYDYGTSAAALARRHSDRLAPWRGRVGIVAPWWLLLRGNVVLGTSAMVATHVWQIAWIHRLTGLPWGPTARLVGHFTSATVSATTRAIRRGWWPIVAIAVWRSPTARRVAVVAAVAAGGPIRVVDDLAYSAGVWQGVVRRRTLRPLTPIVSELTTLARVLRRSTGRHDGTARYRPRPLRRG